MPGKLPKTFQTAHELGGKIAGFAPALVHYLVLPSSASATMPASRLPLC